ncbi:unnamed protein product [Blepharisma stoltei]|uniref:Uncharacterized protein n=1 Tax=Blepharisma stoltei TaxID=1481888 RepID=A0AAU9II62_9CILI|nr:unnamed protein product [Blepharisma stoltei]
MIQKKELDFKVYHPQLEAQPGEIKLGLRRFRTHKNETSPSLILMGSIPKIPDNFSEKTPHSRNLSTGRVPDSYPEFENVATKDYSFQKPITKIKRIEPDQNGFNPHSKERNLTADRDPYLYKKSMQRSIGETFSAENNRIEKSEQSPLTNFDFLRHPTFSGPKFTKRNPKIVLNNPIIGYSGINLPEKEKSMSPGKSRAMADYGNLMMRNGIRPSESLNLSY